MSTRKEAAMPRRCYSYDRISQGGRQARGHGLQRQAGFAEELAVENGWVLDDRLRYIDKGKSAFHRRNLKPTAALGRFLRDIENKVVLPGSVLIIESLDRLSRADVGKAYDLFRGILNAGIWIATSEPKRIYREEDSDNFLAILEPLFIFSRANEESKTKGTRIRDNWECARQAAKEGKPHQCRPPRWIRRTSSGYELTPEKAAIVRRIYLLAAEGRGADRIAQLLNREQVPTFNGKGRWMPIRIRRILRNRTTVGEYTPHRHEGDFRVPITTVPNYYPAVVSEQEWGAAQLAIDSRRKRRGRPAIYRINLFTGLAFDGDSGLPLQGTPVATKKGTIAVLTTRVPGGPRLRCDIIEPAILGAIAQLTLPDVIGGQTEPSEAEQRLAKARARHMDLTRRRQQIQAMLADPRFTVDDLAPALAENTELLHGAENELREAQWHVESSRGDCLTCLQSLHDALMEAEGDAAEELRHRIKETLPSIVERIEVRRIGPVRRGARYLVHLRFWGGAERVFEVPSSWTYGKYAT